MSNYSGIAEIPIVWDFDLTVSKEYQQIPLFLSREAAVKAQLEKDGFTYKQPHDYFARVDALGGGKGIAYMQQIVWDARPGGCLEGLTLPILKHHGKSVTPAPGFIEMLPALADKYKGKAAIRHFIVSVGIKEMIQGFIEHHNIAPYITDVAASEFFTDKNGIVNGIKDVVDAFGKTKNIIQFMKGNPELLNIQLDPDAYKYDYRKLIVIGDGFTDTSKFGYSKKQGATPVVVYRAGDEKAFKKAKDSVGNWVDYVLPQDYTPQKITFEKLCEIIDRKISARCDQSPQTLHNYRKGKPMRIGEIRDLEEHVFGGADGCGCPECKNFFQKTIVYPDGSSITTRTDGKYKRANESDNK